MTRWPSSTEQLRCHSWLVYAPRATGDAARRIKNLVLQVKTDRIDPQSGFALLKLLIDRVVTRVGADVRGAFEGNVTLVPVPRSTLTRPNTIWPARRICEELLSVGLGRDVVLLLLRTTAVSKSAGSSTRPRLREHLRSLAVRSNLIPPSRLLLVDDVVTSGATMMASAMTLSKSLPGVPVSGFALARTLSKGGLIVCSNPWTS